MQECVACHITPLIPEYMHFTSLLSEGSQESPDFYKLFTHVWRIKQVTLILECMATVTTS